MASSIKEEKQRLRKHIKGVLSQMDRETVRQQSATVTKKILGWSEYEKAKSISVFLAMPGREISTTDIVLDALSRGKQVFIPYIHAPNGDKKDQVMEMLRLRDVQDLNSLEPDGWGIPSLSSDSIEARENALGGKGVLHSDVEEQCAKLDLIFVPGMAFDTSKNRLGHGKGFYDKYLSHIRRLSLDSQQDSRFPQLVGLALREQLLSSSEQVPTNENDWKIDHLMIADD